MTWARANLSQFKIRSHPPHFRPRRHARRLHQSVPLRSESSCGLEAVPPEPATHVNKREDSLARWYNLNDCGDAVFRVAHALLQDLDRSREHVQLFLRPNFNIQRNKKQRVKRARNKDLSDDMVEGVGEHFWEHVSRHDRSRACRGRGAVLHQVLLLGAHCDTVFGLTPESN